VSVTDQDKASWKRLAKRHLGRFFGASSGALSTPELRTAARAVLYSHFRPPTAHRRQIGFASSHFTRRALQVLHPVRTLDVLSRVLFGARGAWFVWPLSKELVLMLQYAVWGPLSGVTKANGATWPLTLYTSIDTGSRLVWVMVNDATWSGGVDVLNGGDG
jgi:hypothetical protein